MYARSFQLFVPNARPPVRVTPPLVFSEYGETFRKPARTQGLHGAHSEKPVPAKSTPPGWNHLSFVSVSTENSEAAATPPGREGGGRVSGEKHRAWIRKRKSKKTGVLTGSFRGSPPQWPKRTGKVHRNCSGEKRFRFLVWSEIVAIPYEIRWWAEKDSNLRRYNQQIYSLPHLATLESAHLRSLPCAARRVSR